MKDRRKTEGRQKKNRRKTEIIKTEVRQKQPESKEKYDSPQTKRGRFPCNFRGFCPFPPKNFLQMFFFLCFLLSSSSSSSFLCFFLFVFLFLLSLSTYLLFSRSLSLAASKASKTPKIAKNEKPY